MTKKDYQLIAKVIGIAWKRIDELQRPNGKKIEDIPAWQAFCILQSKLFILLKEKDKKFSESKFRDEVNKY